MIDLSKLTPAPWVVGRIPQDEEPDTCIIGTGGVFFIRVVGGPGHPAEDTANKIVAGLRAFDVMMKYGWHPVRIASGPLAGGWFVKNELGHTIADLGLPNSWPDPFTAIVETYKWHKEKVEVVNP